MPGSDEQKKALLNCIGCHDLDRIVRSTHDADEFMQIFDRMAGYYPGSTPEHPQRLIGTARRNDRRRGPACKATAEYLASRQPVQRRHLDLSRCRPCRARTAAPPTSSSPSTTCRARRSSRMT